jgi:hypothetical protein
MKRLADLPVALRTGLWELDGFGYPNCVKRFVGTERLWASPPDQGDRFELYEKLFFMVSAMSRDP